jgi:hypothetical protein
MAQLHVDNKLTRKQVCSFSSDEAFLGFAFAHMLVDRWDQGEPLEAAFIGRLGLPYRTTVACCSNCHVCTIHPCHDDQWPCSPSEAPAGATMACSDKRWKQRLKHTL